MTMGSPEAPDIIHGPVPAEPNVFFTPHAFAMAHATLSGLQHDFGVLDVIAAEARSRFGHCLVNPVEEYALVYRYGTDIPSRARAPVPIHPSDWIHAAPDDTAYVPSSELARPLDVTPLTVTKAEVLAAGSPLEIRASTFTGPLLPAFIGTLAGRRAISAHIPDARGWTNLFERNFIDWPVDETAPAQSTDSLSEAMMARYPRAIARALRPRR